MWVFNTGSNQFARWSTHQIARLLQRIVCYQPFFQNSGVRCVICILCLLQQVSLDLKVFQELLLHCDHRCKEVSCCFIVDNSLRRNFDSYEQLRRENKRGHVQSMHSYCLGQQWGEGICNFNQLTPRWVLNGFNHVCRTVDHIIFPIEQVFSKRSPFGHCPQRTPQLDYW